jgi:4-nitrophenyl phosphatase
MLNLEKIRAMILDMDGVLVRGKTMLPGVENFLQLLEERAIQYVIATNNSTVDPQQLADRFQSFGLQIKTRDIFTSSLATATFLKKQLPAGTPLYVIGEDPLHQSLCDAGFQIMPTHDAAQAVVVGLDFDISWKKLSHAVSALCQGARFFGTNADLTLPTEDGFAPGNGAFLKLLEAATGNSPQIIGKPEPHLYLQAMEHLGTQAEETLALGDRLETDILGGNRAGIATALVLTGVSRRDDLQASEIHPDGIFEDLIQLTQTLAERVP